MRNISFDDSLVLTEYARIAHEKGLIKTAEQLTPGAQQTQAPADKAQHDKALVDKFKDFVAKNPGQAANDELMPKEQWLVALDASDLDAATKKQFADTLTGIMGVLPDFQKKVDTMKTQKPELYKALEPKVQLALSRKISSRTEGLKVEAVEVYDVSGETGKDLVDSAHPGNMHTEITHDKKNDGALVETIVEQQEADIQVAHSVPKGTYAALMGLRDRLSKLGHVEVVAELDKAIELVATPQDVLKYTLVSLANELDARGFVEIANKVDALTKKAIEGIEDPNTMTSYSLPAETKQQAPMTGEDYKKLQQSGVGSTPADKAGQVALKFQQAYNKLMGSPILVEDGKWGPKTNAAWKEVDGWKLQKPLPIPESKMIQPAPVGPVSPVPSYPSAPQATIPGFEGVIPNDPAKPIMSHPYTQGK